MSEQKQVEQLTAALGELAEANKELRARLIFQANGCIYAIEQVRRLSAIIGRLSPAGTTVAGLVGGIDELRYLAGYESPVRTPEIYDPTLFKQALDEYYKDAKKDAIK